MKKKIEIEIGIGRNRHREVDGHKDANWDEDKVLDTNR